MGLTLHYRGRFKAQAALPEMIAEVKNIAEVNSWRYTIFNEEFPEPELQSNPIQETLYGMIMNIPQCEPVFLCFASDLHLVNPVWLEPASQGQLEDQEMLYLVFTKTQYAGAEIHKKIVHLLKYISQKYFDDFIVADDGQYWETGDPLILDQQFKQYNQYLSAVQTSIGSMPASVNESPDELVNRIVQLLKNNPDFKGLDEEK
ncbi:MAG: hypothetical protein SH818_06340 [Saprospiraceae bacterium]|nr:hypothetical protein [Saprospiraceae bacterium]